MEIVIGVVALAVGLVGGWVLGIVRAAERVRRAEVRAAEAAARLDAERRVADERVAAAQADQDRLREQFRALAAEALQANSEHLVHAAEERLRRAQTAGAADLAQQQDAVRRLVEPLTRTLDEVKAEVATAERARLEAHAALAEQLRAMRESSELLRSETGHLVTALRASQVRGRWGEVQLRRVVELAGMMNHVDFEEQETVRDGEGKNLRPDLTVKLAGGRTIVVDSKVALNALLEAFETDDEAVRAERLQAHARQVKKHVDDLASKRYWEQFDSAPEFVVMFVPSEAFYQSALEQDPALQEYAFSKQVVIATPTTLVAMLRTVAHAWKEDALAKNAQKVLATGKELYERLVTMGGHLSRVGKALDNAGKAYNATVASLESRVMVSARRFGEMQHLAAELPPTERVETEIRQIASAELADAAEDAEPSADDAQPDAAEGADTQS